MGRGGVGKGLSAGREQRLLSPGVKKTAPPDALWRERCDDAKVFFVQHGHLDIPKDYVSASGESIGRWLPFSEKNRQDGSLSEKRIALLDRLGMVWSSEDKWEKGFGYAQAYFKSHGDLLVRNDYVTKDGYPLGIWIANQRFAYKGNVKKWLTDEQKRRLDEIGFVADMNEYKWNYAYERAAGYYHDNGTVRVPRGYKVDGIDLQSWFTEQRRAIKSGKLTPTQRAKLSRLKIVDT